MKAQFNLFLSVALVLSATSVMADQGKGGGDKGGGDNGPSFTLTWDQFKAQCQDPQHSPIQHAPENIVVQCTDVRHAYVPESSGNIPLAASRVVTTAVSSNKFYVRAESDAIDTQAGVGQCLRYKEVEESFTIEKALSCADVLSIKGDVKDYCASATDLVKNANPKVVNYKDTGALIDTCGANSLGGGKDAANK